MNSSTLIKMLRRSSRGLLKAPHMDLEGMFQINLADDEVFVTLRDRLLQLNTVKLTGSVPGDVNGIYGQILLYDTVNNFYYVKQYRLIAPTTDHSPVSPSFPVDNKSGIIVTGQAWPTAQDPNNWSKKYHVEVDGTVVRQNPTAGTVILGYTVVGLNNARVNFAKTPTVAGILPLLPTANSFNYVLNYVSENNYTLTQNITDCEGTVYNKTVPTIRGKAGELAVTYINATQLEMGLDPAIAQRLASGFSDLTSSWVDPDILRLTLTPVIGASRNVDLSLPVLTRGEFASNSIGITTNWFVNIPDQAIETLHYDPVTKQVSQVTIPLTFGAGLTATFTPSPSNPDVASSIDLSLDGSGMAGTLISSDNSISITANPTTHKTDIKAIKATAWGNIGGTITNQTDLVNTFPTRANLDKVWYGDAALTHSTTGNSATITYKERSMAVTPVDTAKTIKIVGDSSLTVSSDDVDTITLGVNGWKPSSQSIKSVAPTFTADGTLGITTTFDDNTTASATTATNQLVLLTSHFVDAGNNENDIVNNIAFDSPNPSSLLLKQTKYQVDTQSQILETQEIGFEGGTGSTATPSGFTVSRDASTHTITVSQDIPVPVLPTTVNTEWGLHVSVAANGAKTYSWKQEPVRCTALTSTGNVTISSGAGSGSARTSINQTPAANDDSFVGWSSDLRIQATWNPTDGFWIRYQDVPAGVYTIGYASAYNKAVNATVQVTVQT